jgi:hypothetical protein
MMLHIGSPLHNRKGLRVIVARFGTDRNNSTVRHHEVQAEHELGTVLGKPAMNRDLLTNQGDHVRPVDAAAV